MSTGGSKSGFPGGIGDGDGILDCECDPNNEGKLIQLPVKFCTPTSSPAPTPEEPPSPPGSTDCQDAYDEWFTCVTANGCLPATGGTCIVAPDDLPDDGLESGTLCEEIFEEWFEDNSGCCANCTEELNKFEECKACNAPTTTPTGEPTAVPTFEEEPTNVPTTEEEPTSVPTTEEEPTSAPTEDICSDIVLIDFETDSDGNELSGGTCVSNEWLDDGLKLLATGCQEIPCLLDSSTVRRKKTVLGSPNELCTPSGPGIGEGGIPGADGENCAPQN